MQKKLEEFVARIPDFTSLRPGQQLEFFAYFLTEVLKEDGISSRRIHDCFDELRIPAYSNIPAYIIANSQAYRDKPPIFVRIKGKTYLHRERSATLASRLKGSHLVVAVKTDLRDLLPKIKDPNQKTFLEEALACFEVKAYRAAIIMVWILTVDHLSTTSSRVIFPPLTKFWLRIPTSVSKFPRSAYKMISRKFPKANSSNSAGLRRSYRMTFAKSWTRSSASVTHAPTRQVLPFQKRRPLTS